MIRREIKNEAGKAVFYIVNDDINVSEIISELSAVGCKGEELGKAYRQLTSDNKGYYYENSETKEEVFVIDEQRLKDCSFDSNPFLYLIWSLFSMRVFAPSPSREFLQDLKKGGEVI